MAKLLLVEDDNNLREIYEARLQAEGYQIVSARDGEEALVIAKAEKPDLIISDVMMPKISGFEMLDILRNTEELKGVKVIMLTALGQSDDQQRADKLGADRYLVKSQVTLEDIIKVAHELLGDQPEQPAAPAPQAADASAPAPAPPAPAAPPVPAPAPTPEPKSEPPAPAPPPPPTPAPEPAPPPPPAPAPEPTPPEPQPKTEPAATDNVKKDASKADGVAKPTNQEEADVEARIEDFVAGASSEPTAPSASPDDAGKAASDDAAAEPAGGATATAQPESGPETPKSEPTPAPTPAPAPTSQAQTKGGSSASDDKLMADAVKTLVASTDDKDSSAPEPVPAAKATTITISTDSGTPDDKASDSSSSTEDDNPVRPKRVIKPLNSKPKKDINQLLAEEEAKEIQTTPGATVIGATSEDEDKPAGAPMAPPSAAATNDNPKPASPDPGSIAL